ncbi:MAG: cyclic-phosphate processing receiver domain-containing protein [Actinomycetota bacterium]
MTGIGLSSVSLEGNLVRGSRSMISSGRSLIAATARRGTLKVWLDDERDPREWLPSIRWWQGRDAAELGDWVWVQTAPEAIRMLATAHVDEISLDHDLGGAEAGTGYDVLEWIERRVRAEPSYAAPAIHIHTSNVAARRRIWLAVVAIERFSSQRMRRD